MPGVVTGDFQDSNWVSFKIAHSSRGRGALLGNEAIRNRLVGHYTKNDCFEWCMAIVDCFLSLSHRLLQYTAGWGSHTLSLASLTFSQDPSDLHTQAKIQTAYLKTL